MNARLTYAGHGTHLGLQYRVLDSDWDITRLSYHRGRVNYTILYLDGALLGEAYTQYDRDGALLCEAYTHYDREMSKRFGQKVLFPYVVLDGKRVYLHDMEEMIQ